MNSLLDYLYKHNHWLVFILLESISIVLLLTFNQFQNSVWLSSANVVSGTVYNMKEKVVSYFGLRNENKKLIEQNARLEERLFAMQQTMDSVQLARLTQQEENRYSFGVIAATVVDNSLTKPDNYITINKGSDDGITPGMGVISSEGIVGITFRCTQHYTLVIPILNSQSNISCKIIPGDFFGYLQWNGGDTRYATLLDVPQYNHIEKGYDIVTSGHSSFFPEGLPVGMIYSFKPSDDNLSNDITVMLSTDFSRLKHVFVICNDDSDERLQLSSLTPSIEK